MPPTMVMRLEHAMAPGREAAVASRVAEILTRLAPLRRVALETNKGRRLRYSNISGASIQSYLRDPRCDIVDLDSGREGDITAAARIASGWLARDAERKNFPLSSHIMLPHEPQSTRAQLEAFFDLAAALQAVSGCVSMEAEFGLAHKVAIGMAVFSNERWAHQPGMTERRLRERSTYDTRHVDHEVPSPEWGLLLGHRHLEVVSAEAIEASCVFHRVRRLGDDLIFLQLTDDPVDALRPDYDQLLEPVRQVLAPLLARVGAAA